jgi:hypothetical protein
MTADEKVSGDQFAIEHQGETPLRYHRGGAIQRLGATHPSVETQQHVNYKYASEHDVPDREYFAQTATVGRTKTGRPLKTPKTVQNPSAAAPHTAAFLDYEDRGPDVYIHYANTRRDWGGQGLQSRLVSHLADQFPDKTINFGKVMSPKMWGLKERLEGQGRKTQGHPDF